MDTPAEVAVPRCEITLLLKEDLVRRASALTSDLGGVVEKVLFAWVSREEANRADPGRFEQQIAAMDAYRERTGLLSDEFSSL